MRNLTKLSVVLVAALAPSFTAFGSGAGATVGAQQAAATITITDFIYNPAELSAKVGEAITITNNDGFIHSVTANDNTFNLDVPGNGSVTLTVSKAGAFPYTCTYHPGTHNPATINVS